MARVAGTLALCAGVCGIGSCAWRPEQDPAPHRVAADAANQDPAAPTAVPRAAPSPRRRLRAVRVETRDVFSPAQEADNLFFRLANLLHVPTRPYVIEREVFLRRGDPITDAEVQELERNLRNTGLFGAVTSTLAPVGEDGETDLEIRTRDRFSLTAGASAAFFGGVGKISGGISETNLFGTGKRLGVQYRDSEDERRGIVRYDDPQLLGSWHRLNVVGGETEEGALAFFDLERPFKHLTDPLSYGLSGAFEERGVDYFRSGETVAEVPEERSAGRAFVALAAGPRDRRRHGGVEVRVRNSDFDAATGLDAMRVRVPGDTVEVQFGPFFGIDRIHSYEKVVGLDALDYTEDLTLGFGAGVRLAAVHYDQADRSDELQSLVGLNLRAAVAPATDTFVTAWFDSFVRFDGGVRAWQASAALHAFQLSLPFQTLASSLTFDAGADFEGLVPQFTLGEDNGLRGYPAREFAGSRYVRLNLEDRIRTNLEILSIHVGFAAFFDVAWVHGVDQRLSMGTAIRSAGIGMRLGSSNLAGSGVLRVDLAWPLDRVRGEEFDLSLSVSPGQVFNFFGNQTQLQGEFQ